MAIVATAEEVSIGGDLLTLTQAARAKGCNYHALRMYLHHNPGVKRYCIGRRVFVRLVDLVGYIPRGM